ncbi:Uncharacterised protein [uncultured archaeon]|nr:Uncharacterised protein [uncultured archaeon]
MQTQYFTGIRFKPNSEEFRSNPENSPRNALEVAMVGFNRGYDTITVYAERKGKTIGIPYSEINNMEKSSDLDDLIKIVEMFDMKLS